MKQDRSFALLTFFRILIQVIKSKSANLRTDIRWTEAPSEKETPGKEKRSEVNDKQKSQ